MSMRDLVKRVFGKPWLTRILGPIAAEIHYLWMGLVTQGERNRLWKTIGRCGAQLEIIYPWDIRGIEHLQIGDNVFIGPGSLMIAEKGAEIVIGNHIMFGPRVRLIAFDHRFDDASHSIKDSGYGRFERIEICDDVWIGAGATILRGVRVGKGTIVGAGAVLTKSTGENEIWAGNPARKVKDRFTPQATSGV